MKARITPKSQFREPRTFNELGAFVLALVVDELETERRKKVKIIAHRTRHQIAQTAG